MGLVFIDSAFFSEADYAACVSDSHKAAVYCGLRLPHIWRAKAEEWFARYRDVIAAAGFDAWMFRNLESLYCFAESGLLDKTPYILDHGIYFFNSESFRLLPELLPENAAAGLLNVTLPLELNEREIRTLRDNLDGSIRTELAVYGRAPMMVSAQCVNKTAYGCDRTEKTLDLRDRTGARQPVKNSCRFCYGTIYNSVPTVLTDLLGLCGNPNTDISGTALTDLAGIDDNANPGAVHGNRDISKTRAGGAADYYRYEFTVETPDEVSFILSGGIPDRTHGGYTRGHYRRGVI